MPSDSGIREALRKRYPAPAYASFEEVTEGSGGYGQRVDFMAMNLWASRGYHLEGFEIKTSRSDWLRELKRPDKAETIFKRCDFWYLVAPREAYRPDEIPEPWGVIDVLGDNTLRISKKAPKLKALPLDRALMAMLLRRDDQKLDRLIEQGMNARSARLEASIEERIKNEVERKTKDLRADGEQWTAFCAALGVKDYTAPVELAKAIKAVRALGLDDTYNGIAAVENTLRRALERVGRAKALFDPENSPADKTGV